ncbi:cadherin-related family member 5 isoform X1 [Apodemus sylvaticus]|uniref:cadherin-related family member 5 isoform X1 n=1 Tax=Apodemus sylvaticus TaxID=10129 RepID=UPI00224299AB|nr:cadherin-related family member 5 isoform X1 [Apodemus sylvaticus]
MGALALLWPPLLWLLFAVLFGQPPGTLAQAQAQVCSVNQTTFTFEENINVSGPLAVISVPEDQVVDLGHLSTPNAFKIENNLLFLNVTPDYEENPLLVAVVECKRGDTVVTQIRVIVAVLDVNDNEPRFPFTNKEYNVSEDTRVNTIVIPETELKATDADKDDTLVYTLQEVTPNANTFFSLVGPSTPALKLDQTLDYYKNQNMTFRLLARDTWEENATVSHTATATLIVSVLPADLRPPWFLPCSFTDGYVCIQAKYHAVVPTGYKLPSPLTLSPGPIYAVDGDQAINQPIIYSIMTGNTDDTFIINAADGNLTMAKSIPSPMMFTLVVRAEQADKAQYSVTQAIVEARNDSESPLQFSQSLYFGTVVLGSEAGTAVRDKTFPSEFLRIQAQYPGFPDLNSAVMYQVTNSSEFLMNQNIILTTVPMEEEKTIRIEVGASNTVTKDTATAVVEIQVSEREPPSTESPTPPEAGGTTGPSSNSTLEAPSTSGTSQGPATTSSGGSAGPVPPAGTTLSPPTSVSSVPGVSPTGGISTSPETAIPGGDSTQTPKPGTSQPMAPIPGASTSSQPATPSGSSTQTPKPGTSQPTATGPISGADELGDDQRFSTTDMAVLGGVLGALLLLAVICLFILVYKHYRHRLACCCGKASKPEPSGYDNLTFVPDHKAKWSPTPTRKPEPVPEPAQPPLRPPSPMSSSPTPPSSTPPSPQLKASGSPKTVQAGDSPSAVRSILTKERRPEGEGGYKAVWFGKDIGAEADVVVLNEPTADVDSASASGSEGSDDDDPGHKKSVRFGGAPADIHL